MSPPIFISHIATAVPTYKLRQQDVVEQQIDLWQLNADQSRRLRHLFSKTGIQTRYSAFEQWTSGYDKTTLRTWLNSGIESKMQDYRLMARPLAAEAARKSLNNTDTNRVGAIITVSCTGLYAPGLELDLIYDLGLAQDIKRYPINFVGCYAMFTALDLAKSVAAALADSDRPLVLVVGVELCTLHYGADYTPDAALAHALFADGASACLVSIDPLQDTNALSINEVRSVVVPSERDMAWHLGPNNFQMQLSAYVPGLLSPALKGSLPPPEEAHQYDYAIHPGGRRILEAVAEANGVSEEELFASYLTMAAYGNMSSVTIMFALQILLNQYPPDKQPKEKIVAAGFGPGLTLIRLDLSRHSLA